jgi:hypothetical protein
MNEMCTLGVHLKVKGDLLVIDAPTGVINSEYKKRLKALKPELIKAIRTEPVAASFKAYTISTKSRGGEVRQHSMIDRTGRSLEQVRCALLQQFKDRLINVELNK